MSKFKLNDRVVINHKSKFANGGSENPSNVIGTVEEMRNQSFLPIRVRWDNGTVNSYTEEDLNIVRNKNSNKVKKVKPPKRTKTDGVITYTNGKSYNLKNIESVYITTKHTVITVAKSGFKGVKRSEVFTLTDVEQFILKTPKAKWTIEVTKDYVFIESSEIMTSSEYFMYTKDKK